MYNPYGQGPGLNRFLLISVVFHAILFITLPNLDALYETDLPGLAGGGIIQIMQVDNSLNTRRTPQVDPLSQSTVPKVTEPRPLPEEEPVEQAAAESAESEGTEPLVERGQPVTPEPPLIPEPSVREEPVDNGEGDLLTSPSGPEVVVEDEDYKDEVLEEEQESGGISGSGQGAAGDGDQSAPSQSGAGAAEISPPTPAPPPSGRTLYLGGGSPVYPKDAEHDGIEGTVVVVLEVSAEGRVLIAEVLQSSGDQRLDRQALNHLSHSPFEPLEYPYTMDVGVIFEKVDNRFGSRFDWKEGVKQLHIP